MSTNKRRKLNTAEQHQVLSAFARLKKFSNQGLPPEQADETSVEPPKSEKAREKKSKKSHSSYTRLSSTGEDTVSNGQDETVLDAGATTPYEPPQETENEGSLEQTQATTPDATPTIQLSSFRATKANFQKKPGGKQQLKLTGGERVVILGSYGIRVVSGGITINGALVRPSEKTLWVHAPSCHALPVVRCSDDTVVVLESHQGATQIEKLGDLLPHFSRIWNDRRKFEAQKKGQGSNPTFKILFTSADGPRKTALHDLRCPPEWNRELDKLVTASRSRTISVMVTGPKSSGKSTFGRILTNQLLTGAESTSKERKTSGIAVLDLDPGQPEHCIAGQIALVHITEPLLEPSFCRPLPGFGTRVVRSHTLASITPASDPELYLACAADLFNYYRNSLGHCPLIVNTPGWIQGTGLNLLTSLIDILRPTHLMYMAAGPVDVVESLQESFKTGQLTKLPSQPTQNTARNAAHLRAMQTMSYFHTESRAGKAKAQNWNVNPITTFPPWQIKYTGPTPGILGIMCYDYQAPPELLVEAINGTILAVVEIESPLAFRIDATGEEIGKDSDMRTNIDDENQDAISLADVKKRLTMMTPESIPFINTGSTLDPRYSRTIGLVLIRGIDSANGFLQVLTPIPEAEIEEINKKGGKIVLVSGKFDPPTWAYTEDLYHQSSQNVSKQGNEDADGDQRMDGIEDVDDSSEGEDLDLAQPKAPTPWTQVLHSGEKRGAGKVWRVRRDLGRTGN